MSCVDISIKWSRNIKSYGLTYALCYSFGLFQYFFYGDLKLFSSNWKKKSAV